jgi:hypothetical protein
VKAEAGEFTVKIRRDRTEVGVERTFTLARTARVLVDGGKPAKLSDLPPGTDVQIFLSPTTKKVLQLTADGPTIRGEVRAVDPEGRWITLLQGEAREHTYAVLAPREGDRREPPGQSMRRWLGLTVQAKLSVDRASILHFQFPRR